MRHLFVPACLCLMTISGSTGHDPKSLETFTGYSVVKKSERGEPSTIETAAATEETSEAWTLFDTKRTENLQGTTALASAEIGVTEQNALKYFLDPLPGSEAEGPPAPPPKPVIHRSKQEVCETLVEAAQTNDLPTPFFIRLLQQESGFKPGVVSPVGAQGVAQFMPMTAFEMGVDNPFDPLEAIPASAKMLKNLFKKFGNLGLAAAAYNAGPKRVQDWLEKKSKLPDETRGYVKTITGKEAESWKLAAAGMTNIKLPRVAPCQQSAGLHAWNGPKDIPLPPHRGGENIQLVAAAKPVHTEKKPVQIAKKDDAKPATVQLAAHKVQTQAKPAVEAKKTGKKPGKPLQLAAAAR